jgi:hypothetical protein
MDKVVPLSIVFAFVLLLVGISVLAIRWARRSSRRAAFLGWGLQFLGAGINPQPPPQAKLEEASLETRIKKEAEAGDPEGLDA